MRDETANTAGDQSDHSDITETANVGGKEGDLQRMSEATVGMSVLQNHRKKFHNARSSQTKG